MRSLPDIAHRAICVLIDQSYGRGSLPGVIPDSGANRHSEQILDDRDQSPAGEQLCPPALVRGIGIDRVPGQAPSES